MVETTNVPQGTIELLNEETRLAQAQREKISRVTLQLEEILLKEEMTVGDLLEIFGLFTGRANDVFAKMPIKTIKENYERNI